MISINCLMNWRIDGMKKVFYIVGAGIVAGVVATIAAYLMRCMEKEKCGSNHEWLNPGEEGVLADDEASTEVIITDGDIYEDVKKSTIGSTYFRHEDAATIMSDSVEAIRENIKVSESTNDEIDEVSAELDKMLSED